MQLVRCLGSNAEQQSADAVAPLAQMADLDERLAEFIYGAVYFPWNGGGEPRDAAIAAVAWAFGGLELTSATTLLALGGRNRLKVIDNPMQLKTALQSRSAVRLAGIGASISPLGSGLKHFPSPQGSSLDKFLPGG